MSVSKFDSYPPLFRPRGGGATDSSISTTTVAANDVQLHPNHDEEYDSSVVDPLPVVDFHNMDHEKLGEACRDWGMFRLVNHGVPVTLFNQLDDHVKKIFSIGFDDKQEIFKDAPISYFWGTPGLSPSGKALPNLQQEPRKCNLIEGFHVTCSGLSNTVYQNAMADYFRTLLEEYESHLIGTATKIFEALALNLNLDATQTKTYLSAATTGQLRVHRYPCQFDDDHHAWGIDSHTDSTVLTILHQDEVGGLQFLSKDDKWFDVKPVPDSLIINLGDVMQAMSDDKYMAPKHRVKAHKEKERISVGYFVFPYDDTVIKSSKYKPFTYPDFRAQVQQDLKTVGYKIGLPRFKLVDNV